VAKTVEFHNPDFEDNVLFDVGGLAIPNGTSVELSEDDELSFFSRHQKGVSEYFAGDKHIKVSGKSLLSRSVITDHTGKAVSAEPPALDATVLDDVEPPVDSEGNEVDTEGTALHSVGDDKEVDE